ncbi:MAG: hypothetical protein WC600_17185 [Desulfobaccales bacterium]
MSEPVKTTLLKAIEAALGTIPGLPTVRREFDLPFDLDAVDADGIEIIAKPALFFWEDPEDLEEDNLMARNTLHLSLTTFIKLQGEIGDGQTPAFQTFADEADALAGQIHRLLTDPVNLATWQSLGLLDLEPQAQSKALASELYGEMVITYRLTYWHRLGDSTSLNLQ